MIVREFSEASDYAAIIDARAGLLTLNNGSGLVAGRLWQCIGWIDTNIDENRSIPGVFKSLFRQKEAYRKKVRHWSCCLVLQVPVT